MKPLRPFFPMKPWIIVDNISRLPGGEQLVADVILENKQAAEDAAKDVAPFSLTA